MDKQPAIPNVLTSPSKKKPFSGTPIGTRSRSKNSGSQPESRALKDWLKTCPTNVIKSDKKKPVDKFLEKESENMPPPLNLSKNSNATNTKIRNINTKSKQISKKPSKSSKSSTKTNLEKYAANKDSTIMNHFIRILKPEPKKDSTITSGEGHKVGDAIYISPVRKYPTYTMQKITFDKDIFEPNLKQESASSETKLDTTNDEEDSPVKINPENVLKKIPVKYNEDFNDASMIDGKNNNNVQLTATTDQKDEDLVTKVKNRKTMAPYGFLGAVPSFSDILQDCDHLTQVKKKFEHISDVLKQNKTDAIPITNFETSKELPVLSCDHLTISEINNYFFKYKSFCSDILEGRIQNERHSKFFSENPINLTMQSLTYNTSMITFSHEQKDRLAKLCERHFHSSTITELSKYIFQVLLPELCLKIFMDVHQFDYEEATEYLNNRPVSVL